MNTNNLNLESLQLLQESGLFDESFVKQIMLLQQIGMLNLSAPQVQPKKDYTNEELIEWYLEELSVQKAEKTVKAYQSDFKTFLDWLGDRKIVELTHTDALRYVKHLRETKSSKGKGYSLATINRKHTAMCAFYSFLTTKGVIELRKEDKNKNIFQQIDLISTDHLKIEHDFLTKEECQRFLEAIETDTRCRSKFAVTRNLFMYELMMATGLRFEEVQNLKEEDFDLKNNQISALGKRNKRRNVPFSKVYHELYLEFLELRKQITDAEVDNLFISEVTYSKDGVKKGGKVLTHQQSIYTIDSYIKSAGIELNGRRITNHSLRHTYASHQIDEGCHISKLSKLMGHVVPSFTQEHYVHVVATDEDDKIAERLAYSSRRKNK